MGINSYIVGCKLSEPDKSTATEVTELIVT